MTCERFTLDLPGRQQFEDFKTGHEKVFGEQSTYDWTADQFLEVPVKPRVRKLTGYYGEKEAMWVCANDIAEAFKSDLKTLIDKSKCLERTDSDELMFGPKELVWISYEDTLWFCQCNGDHAYAQLCAGVLRFSWT